MRFATRLILLYIVVCIAPIAASLYFDKHYAQGYGSHPRGPVSPKIAEEKGTTESPPSNLGCFLCTQMLSVTKQRVGLSQAQLKIVLQDRCKSLPDFVRSQCYAFISDSLPQIYSSFVDDAPSKNICEILNLCDVGNPFSSVSITETTPTTSQSSTDNNAELITVKKVPQKPYNIITTTSKPVQPKEEQNNSGLKETLPKPGDQKMNNKRLTCLFCERMLTNAKNYALTAKSEIAAFASASCSKLREKALVDQCYQLTDRKINELAIFVDEQVVEALWCAQMNHC